MSPQTPPLKKPRTARDRQFPPKPFRQGKILEKIPLLAS